MATNATSIGVSFPTNRLKRELQCKRFLEQDIFAATPPSDAAKVSQRYSEPHTSRALSSLPPFVLKMDNPWLRRINLSEARNIIFSFENIAVSVEFAESVRLEWPLEIQCAEMTGTDFVPAYNKLNEETAEFVRQRGLRESVDWLRMAMLIFFPAAGFEIDLLPAEDGEENMLALRVYDSLPVSEFRKQRHAMCKVMLETGHEDLYKIISIFQRRMRGNGWQVLSWYSSLSAE